MKRLEDRGYLIILFIGILFTILSPIILTLPSISRHFNFTSTGNIGDTIGGLTAPIVGLLGAILVYRSFIIQKKANEEIRKENFLKLLDDYIDKLADDRTKNIIIVTHNKCEIWINYIKSKQVIDPRELETKIRETKNSLLQFGFLLTRTNYLFDKIYSDKVNEVERGFILLFEINEKFDKYFQIATLRKIEEYFPEIYSLTHDVDKDLFKLFNDIKERLKIFMSYYSRITEEIKSK